MNVRELILELSKMPSHARIDLVDWNEQVALTYQIEYVQRVLADPDYVTISLARKPAK